MLRLRRRCAQTARISLHSFSFQRAKTQNKRTANPLALHAALHPDISQTSFRTRSAPASLTLPSASPPLRFASFSVFRFGEAVFTDRHSDPQEEKTPTVVLFSHFLVLAQNLGVTGNIPTKDAAVAKHSFGGAARLRPR